MTNYKDINYILYRELNIKIQLKKKIKRKKLFKI